MWHDGFVTKKAACVYFKYNNIFKTWTATFKV